MATEGGVKEGSNYNYGPRYNNTLYRGQAVVTGNLVITLPLPMRFVGFVQAEIVSTTGPTAGHIVTVGNIGSGGNKGNQFTIFVWQTTTGTNLVASTTATTVMWQAWGAVTDNFVSNAY